MSIASVTTRGYNPPSASIGLVTLMGYGGTGGAPPVDQPQPPRGGAPVWWPGKNVGDDDRKRRLAALEAQRRAEIYGAPPPVKREAPVVSEKKYKPPISVEINEPVRKIATGKKRTEAWMRTAERFSKKRKKRESEK